MAYGDMDEDAIRDSVEHARETWTDELEDHELECVPVFGWGWLLAMLVCLGVGALGCVLGWKILQAVLSEAERWVK